MRVTVLLPLDYCGATLACLPVRLLERLQSDLNAAARLVFGSSKFMNAPVTPLLHDLHWCRVPERITFQLAVLVYHSQHALAPPYLADELTCDWH